MAKSDYYETLGLARDADDAAIKSAYRKLAKEYHPDRNQGDDTAEQRFKEVSEAYEALKDPQKRAAYDQFGHAAFEGGMGGAGAHGFNGEFGASMSDIFDDLFGEFMGGRRGIYAIRSIFPEITLASGAFFACATTTAGYH